MEMLAADLTRIALCWRLMRRDGVTLGFTSHDRPLVIAGVPYRAAPGMLPSEIAATDGFDADALDIQGALTSDALRAADLKAGRWDHAAVRVFMVDWGDPDGAQLTLARGTLGTVSLSGAGYEAELRGIAAELERPVVAQTSPECRATLGDRQCRIDMAGRSTLARIAAVDGETVVTLDTALGADFDHGQLRWLGGANSGLEAAVKSAVAGQVTLREAPAFAPAIGDRVLMRQGCDKSFATCAGRFANAINFQGEPHLPGLDLLTRYPGA